MTDLPLTEIGVSGVLVVIVLREVFSFIKVQKNNKNGNSGITRNEFEKHKESVQYKDNCEQIVKRIDAAFVAQEKMFEMIEENFKDVKKLIKNGAK